MGRITGSESGAIMTLAYSYVTQLPKANVSELTQLQWAIAGAETLYGEAAANADAVWKMFDQAVEDGNKEAKNDLAELATYCEFVKYEAYIYLDTLKRDLLAINN